MGNPAKFVGDYREHHGAGWTEERVETLKALWKEGRSASQIAKQLGGVSRNAVVGKVHRIGLAGRATPSRPVVRRHPIEKKRGSMFLMRRTKAPEDCPAPYVSAPETLVPMVANVLELSRNQCKWPLPEVDEGMGFSFCGREASGVYCPEHEAKAHAAQRPDRKIKVAIKESKTAGQWR